MSKQIYGQRKHYHDERSGSGGRGAFGIAGDKIAVIGSNADVMAWGGDDEVVDIGGKRSSWADESHNHISIGAFGSHTPTVVR